MNWKVAATVLVLVGALAILILLAPRPPAIPLPPPAISTPVPSKPSPELARDYEDADEDAVMELEDMLSDLAAQVRRRAWGGALYHVAADFEGSPLLREADGAAQEVGGVSIATAGPDARRLDRVAFGKALVEFPVDSAVFKIPRAKLEGETLSGQLKLDASRTSAGRAKRWVSTGNVEFVHRNGRWLLRKFDGAGVKTEEGAVRFLDVTARVGLKSQYGYDDRDNTQVTFGRLFLGGIAAGDIDGDGRVDLFVPQIGSSLLFRNEGGRFRECAKEWGISNEDTGAAAIFLDYDNDGLLDLLIVNHEPEKVWDRKTKTRVDNAGHRAIVLYHNVGGRFVDVTREAGLECRGPAMNVVAADVNGDGLLDFYVCMYKDESLDDPDAPQEVPRDVAGARDGVPNQLWINQGNGTFKEEAAKRGVADTGWSLAAAFADFDGDGKPDLYLANDYGENRLYRNRGDGTFEDVTSKSGTRDAGFGMGATWLDYDGDGKLDLYVSNMYSTAGNRILARGPGKLSKERHEKLLKMANGNTLFRNNGDGTFTDVTKETGVGRAGWAWSSAAYDYDNDGWPDLYVSNGLKTSSFAVADT
jgi:hypothetical protein